MYVLFAKFEFHTLINTNDVVFYAALVAKIVFATRNCVERSCSELWKRHFITLEAGR